MIHSMVASKQNEEFVYQAVLAGDLEIMPDGTIWRIRKRQWDRWRAAAISRRCKRVRAEHDAGKYFQVRIMVDKVRVYALAHRLVYRHFKGVIPEGLTINHRDGSKKNNHPANLAPATHSQQMIHATSVLGVGHAANQAGEKNSMATLTDAQVIEIRRRRATGEKLQPIADHFGIAFQTVSRIARGDRRAG